jgi:hypothetical protein
MDYFFELEKNNSFVYDSLHEKIQNFHPAFHSMTPEGLNSRLTFLLQCTRQGPQIVDQNDNPQNMVFGRPPICVLRIGDFYHTKIVIDSVNITYEPLQWDLNPEGIGVQPMIAKVSLGFKFIGGSSLGGPIQQLQNAVSYNFFANTSVYRPIEIFNQFVEEKNKIIKRAYGSWLTPKDADDFYSKKVAVGVLEEETTTPGESGNNDTTSAGQTQSEKDKIEDNTPVSDTTGSSGDNKSPNVTSSDMNRLLLGAEYTKSDNRLRFVIQRKDSSDNGPLSFDYTVSYLDIIALNNSSNSVKNIPDGTVVSAVNLVTSNEVLIPTPLNNLDTESYSLTVKFNNNIDSLNSGIKII